MAYSVIRDTPLAAPAARFRRNPRCKRRAAS